MQMETNVLDAGKFFLKWNQRVCATDVKKLLKSIVANYT
tara:strand:+ start:19 stop:135 length:117 start_codon:yes stop_codon:yes gene_type:complete